MKRILSTLVIMIFTYNVSADINGVNPPKKKDASIVGQSLAYNDSRNGAGSGGGSRG